MAPRHAVTLNLALQWRHFERVLTQRSRRLECSSNHDVHLTLNPTEGTCEDESAELELQSARR
ncbi:unnamed protein product [Protopolystoma xenopodis]|uniref:Uncharacterized protein n=1 Tax=Protopolystoma xenopodis TaxID=117903 RepID=A0A3S5CS32_9PLAT|nr:unnamed protein product [Protopolystoma xenopodis]